MSRFSLPKILLTTGLALLLASCGSNNSNTVVPPFTPTFSNSSLAGSFVFTAAGTDATDGDYFAAGSFTADGAGNLTGIEDVNLGSGVDSDIPVTGTYLINANGSGTLTLIDASGNKDTLGVQLDTAGGTVLTSFDSGPAGTLERQNLTGFVRSGAYTFSVSGSDNVGALTITGTFTVDSLGNVTGGKQDITENGITTAGVAFTGVMTPVFDGGRGRILLGGNQYSYYVVSANKIILAGLDETVFLHGTATK